MAPREINLQLSQVRTLFSVTPIDESDSTTTTVTTTTLENLPYELLRYIARLLPKESAACLAQCSKIIRFSIGNKHVRRLKASGNEALFCKYKQTLDRDYPSLLHCCHCKHFHPTYVFDRYAIDYYLRPTSSTLDRPFTFNIDPDKSKLGYDYCNFAIFRMAMKKFREGEEYTHLLARLSSEEINGSTYKLYLPRIVDGRMILRIQKIAVIPPGNDWWSIRGNTCAHGWSEARCDRGSASSNNGEPPVLIHTGRPVVGRDERSYITFDHGVLEQCEYCYTEYQFDTEKVFNGDKEIGLAVVFTSWRDLGDGVNCKDPKLLWQVSTHNTEPAAFVPGSLANAFENGKEYQFQHALSGRMMTTHTLYHLRDQFSLIERTWW
ncbi:hypothetical protein F5884DRAFT_811179 [Xylogone sp. PMI_703]|nr:hypothetical protein F5884DRAFT_811179 [Xylogone sp. PMI_703]